MEILEKDWVTFVVIALILMSIICQIVIGFLYQSMILETDNMTATENRLLRQCKLKFANCYQMNKGVANIPVFVDKFINRIRIGWFSLTGIGHFSGQMMLLAVFIAGLGIYYRIVKGATFMELIPHYVICLFGMYAYFSVSSMVDMKSKRNVLKTNLIDYLENHMVNRLKLMPKEQQIKEFINETVPREEKKPRFGGREQKELESLLQELLT